MDQPIKILIADDEPIGQQLLEAILYPEGYELLFAEDGEIAYKEIVENVPALVLCDVMMPKMDGYEVCRKMRQNENTAHIPIFLITALDDRDSRIKGIDAGADDYISKPFDRIEILAKVKNRAILNKFRQKEVIQEASKEPSPTISSDSDPMLQCLVDHLLSFDLLKESERSDIYRSTAIYKSKNAFVDFPLPNGRMFALISSKTEDIDVALVNSLLYWIILKESQNVNISPSQIIQSTLERINRIATEYKLNSLLDANYSLIILDHNTTNNNIIVSGLNQAIFISNSPDAIAKTTNTQAFKPYYLMGNQDLKLTSTKEIMLFSDNILELFSQPDLVSFINANVISGSLKPLSTIIPQRFNQTDDILAVKLSF